MAIPDYIGALEDFREARRKAALEQLLARLSGKSAELLSYNQVRDQLRVTGSSDRGLHQIPVNAIVGSVGRFEDYTRRFQPKLDADEERWAKVKTVMLGSTGLPPIEVFKIGAAYFVKDGNHRVSIARQLGLETISAYVTEVTTRVPLSPDDDADALILKARYANFLERTNLDRLRPGADLKMTVPGHYETLLHHIEVHHYFMHIDQQRSDIPFFDGVTSWYDNVYLPLVELIRETGLDRVFAEYSAADLYVLVSEYYAQLADQLGWRVSTEAAIAQFAQERGGRLDRATPAQPAKQPAAQVGSGRGNRTHRHLFRDILVAGEGAEEELPMLAHAIALAQREEGQLFGLHVLRHEQDRTSEVTQRVLARFEAERKAAGIDAQAALAVGDFADLIIERAAYVDLVVVRLARPVGLRSAARIAPGILSIIQRSPRPLLAVPDGARSEMNRLLLAYDGSNKAHEALSVAAYLAACWQDCDLVVVTAGSPAATAPVLQQARSYLDNVGIAADYVAKDAPVARVLSQAAEENGRNLLIMGGFGYQPALRMILGSTVESMLREFPQPILICR